MKKNLSWKILIGVAIVAYALSYLLGGVIGNALGLLGLICLLLGIVGIFQKPKKEDNK